MKANLTPYLPQFLLTWLPNPVGKFLDYPSPAGQFLDIPNLAGQFLDVANPAGQLLDVPNPAGEFKNTNISRTISFCENLT